MNRWTVVGILTILMSGCIFQQTISTTVPNDLDIIYRNGSCKAEWGQTQMEIFANGTTVKGNVTSRVSQSELLQTLNEIEKSGFYSLNEHYSNLEVHEGSCKFISVTANNRTKMVAVSNMPSPESFSIAADAIYNTVTVTDYVD